LVFLPRSTNKARLALSVRVEEGGRTAHSQVAAAVCDGRFYAPPYVASQLMGNVQKRMERKRRTIQREVLEGVVAEGDPDAV
jgi:L-asparaginase II